MKRKKQGVQRNTPPKPLFKMMKKSSLQRNEKSLQPARQSGAQVKPFDDDQQPTGSCWQYKVLATAPAAMPVVTSPPTTAEPTPPTAAP
jgi:hypothetical protein